jgi:hypothetical protein
MAANSTMISSYTARHDPAFRERSTAMLRGRPVTGSRAGASGRTFDEWGFIPSREYFHATTVAARAAFRR